MNDLQIFKNDMFGEIRTIEIDGKPYFVAGDVAKALGYSNISDAISRHCRWVVKHDIPHPQSPNKSLEVNVIPQGDVVRLTSHSELPGAEKFESWIYDEVVPSVLNRGAYMTPEVLEQAILNPDTIIKIATALKDEQNKNKALQAVNSSLTVDNQIMKPKADYFDELVDRNLLTSFRETAKQLEIGEKKFVKFLLDSKYIYRDKKGKLMPYADKNNGLFEIKETFNEKTQWSGTQTLITPKGRETFRLLFLKAIA